MQQPHQQHHSNQPGTIPVEKLLSETRRLFMALDEAACDVLAACGVSARDRALLEHLARAQGAVEVTTLSRLALSPAHEIRATLDRFRDRGWVERRNEGSTTSARVQLNARGRAAQQSLRDRERALLQEFEHALSTDAVQSACATLRHVRRLLQRSSALVPG